jgi:selenide, water dikinase
MGKLNIPFDSNVLVGSDSKDDAGIYRLNDDLALVQTLDFITPVCDDPFEFGRIAACNSLSDVYAMGGKPVTAMNIVAFPTKKFGMDILGRILEGGLSKIKEAGVQLIGGHSIDDPELKYGLSVTGLISPGRILRNNTIKDGDSLILTKPLGTGIIATAIKAGEDSTEVIKEFISSMAALNKYSAEIMMKYNVNACTDITGFGLAGHILEMMQGNGLSVFINSSTMPVLTGAFENAADGFIPGGLYRNRKYVGDNCIINDYVRREIADIIFDPQTSGGLLISLPKKESEQLVKELHQAGITHASVIGEVKMHHEQRIFIQ